MKSNYLKQILDYKFLAVASLIFCIEKNNSANSAYENLTQSSLFKSTPFFISKAFFQLKPQCCLAFSRIQLQIFLRCCLLHITIIRLIHILYLVYL